MSNDIRVSNPGASTLYEALSFNTKPVEQTEQEVEPQEQLQIEIQDTQETNETPQRGNIPSSTISFDEGPIQEQEPVNYDLPELPIEDNAQLPNINTQNYDPNDPNQIPPMPEEQFPTGDVPQDNDYKQETNNNHSVNKSVMLFEAKLAKGFINKVATNYVTKVTTKAVTVELTEVLAKSLTTATTKSASKIGVDVTAKVTAGATKGLGKTVTDLTVKGLLGKGVATVGVKEGALAAGSLVKGLEASAVASSEILLKGGAKKLLPNTIEALGKTATGAGEKLLQKGLTDGTNKAVQNVLAKFAEESAGKVITEVATKTATKATAKTGTKIAVGTGTKVVAKTGAKASTKAGVNVVEKLTTGAVTKATTEVASKTGVKFATKVGKAMPYISTAIGVGITAYDAYDAIQKTKDDKASTASKVLAWTTVGLDVVSTATTATGKGAPIGWAATGLGIGTSILSDYLR